MTQDDYQGIAQPLKNLLTKCDHGLKTNVFSIWVPLKGTTRFIGLTTESPQKVYHSVSTGEISINSKLKTELEKYAGLSELEFDGEFENELLASVAIHSIQSTTDCYPIFEHFYKRYNLFEKNETIWVADLVEASANRLKERRDKSSYWRALSYRIYKKYEDRISGIVLPEEMRKKLVSPSGKYAESLELLDFDRYFFYFPNHRVDPERIGEIYPTPSYFSSNQKQFSFPQKNDLSYVRFFKEQQDWSGVLYKIDEDCVSKLSGSKEIEGRQIYTEPNQAYRRVRELLLAQLDSCNKIVDELIELSHHQSTKAQIHEELEKKASNKRLIDELKLEKIDRPPKNKYGHFAFLIGAAEDGEYVCSYIQDYDFNKPDLNWLGIPKFPPYFDGKSTKCVYVAHHRNATLDRPDQARSLIDKLVARKIIERKSDTKFFLPVRSSNGKIKYMRFDINGKIEPENSLWKDFKK